MEEFHLSIHISIHLFLSLSIYHYLSLSSARLAVAVHGAHVRHGVAQQQDQLGLDVMQREPQD